MQILMTCTLIVVTAGAAWAAPVTLDARVLLQTPGAVTVDPQNVTAVQFCDEVAWLAYKAPWLHAQISPQDRRVLLLDATAQSGEAALSVWVRNHGAPLQLSVRVSPTTLTNHLYFVSCPPTAVTAQAPGPSVTAPGRAPGAEGGQPAPASQTLPGTSSAGAPSATASWDAFIAHLAPRQWDLFQALVATPTDDTYAAFTASLSPGQAAEWSRLAPAAHLTPPATQAPAAPQTVSVSAAGPQLAPSWLVFQTAAVARSAGGGIIILYTVTNAGTSAVALDAVRLSILDAQDRPARPQVTRQDTSGVDGQVAPGGSESGTIVVLAPVQGPLTVRWLAVEVGPVGGGSTYLLTQTLQIP